MTLMRKIINCNPAASFNGYIHINVGIVCIGSFDMENKHIVLGTADNGLVYGQCTQMTLVFICEYNGIRFSRGEGSAYRCACTGSVYNTRSVHGYRYGCNETPQRNRKDTTLIPQKAI